MERRNEWKYIALWMKNDVLYDIFEDYEDAQNCIDAGGFVEDDLRIVAWEVRED